MACFFWKKGQRRSRKEKNERRKKSRIKAQCSSAFRAISTCSRAWRTWESVLLALTAVGALTAAGRRSSWGEERGREEERERQSSIDCEIDCQTFLSIFFFSLCSFGCVSGARLHLSTPNQTPPQQSACPLTPTRCGGLQRRGSTPRWRRAQRQQLLRRHRRRRRRRRKTATSSMATPSPLLLLLPLSLPLPPSSSSASRPRSRSTSAGSSPGCTRSSGAAVTPIPLRELHCSPGRRSRSPKAPRRFPWTAGSSRPRSSWPSWR